jgi:hypothetical protein
VLARRFCSAGKPEVIALLGFSQAGTATWQAPRRGNRLASGELHGIWRREARLHEDERPNGNGENT